MCKLLLAGMIWFTGCTGSTSLMQDGTADSTAVTVQNMMQAPMGDVVYGRDLRASGATDLVQALVSRIGGMHLVSFRGQPRLSLRNAPSGAEDMLYVLDGMTLSQDGFSVLRSTSVHDVERIDVLKRISDTSMYGARGGAGVIRIWTRRGLADEAP